MSLLDEIKKVSFTPIKFEQVTEPTSLYKPRVFVDLADIENILGEMKCEKCRFNSTIHVLPNGEKNCSPSTFTDIYLHKNKTDFFCSQFEVKDEN